MTEFRRLIDSTDDPLALELLHSAAEEMPSARSLPKTAAVLGIGASLLSGSASGAQTTAVLGSLGAGTTKIGAAALPLAPKAAAIAGTAALPSFSLGLVALAKPLAIGLVSGVFVVGGARYAAAPQKPAIQPSASSLAMRPASHSRPSSMSRAEFVRSNPQASSPEIATPLAQSQEPSAGGELAATKVERRAVEGSRPASLVGPKPMQPSTEARGEIRPMASSRAAFDVEDSVGSSETPVSGAPSDPSLKLEVERLDTARRALLVNDPEAALRELALYRAARPSGVLAPEALVIRIQSLEKLGQHAQAEALARDFIQRYPKHRHAQALSSQFQLPTAR